MWNKSRSLAPVWRVVKLQLILAIICTLIVLMTVHSRNAVISSLVAAMIAIIPTALYIKIAFAKGVVNYPQNALKQHKKAMVARFLASLVLFFLVCCYFRQCNFLVLFIVYIIILSAYWFSLVTIDS